MGAGEWLWQAEQTPLKALPYGLHLKLLVFFMFLGIMIYLVKVDGFLMPPLILWFTFIGSSYYDVMHHNKKPFYLKGMEEDSNIMDAYLMHSVCT